MPNTLGGWGGLYDAVADVGITAGRPEHKVVVILGTDPVEPPLSKLCSSTDDDTDGGELN